MSFVASESPSKTTPESYNRTPYARDGRRNTDTQQVGAWGASLPLRAHHEGAPAQTIPRMQRRARVLRAREPNADPPLLARPGTSPEQLGATQEVGG